MSGCSSHAWLPSRKMGASGSESACCTTITGTCAAAAASMARPMLERLVAVGGSVMGSAPSKYSFWTSITISARFAMGTSSGLRTMAGVYQKRGSPEARARATPRRSP